MRKIVSVFVLCIGASLSVSAAPGGVDSLPEFNYNLVAGNSLDENEFSKQVQKIVGAHSLSEVRLLRQEKAVTMSLSRVDRTWTSADFHQAIFLKFGVVPSDKNLLDKKLPTSEGLLYHGLFKNAPYAVFIRSRDAAWNMQILEKILARKGRPRSSQIWPELLLPRAFAQEEPCAPTSPYKSIWDSIKHLANSSPVQNTLNCLVGVAGGVWNATGGVVVDVGRGAADLLTSPVQTGKKFWRSVNDTWDMVGNFYNDFVGESQKLYSEFDALSDEEKSKLSCEVIASLGTGVAVAYLSGGIGSAVLTKKIAEALAKIKASKTAVGPAAKLKAAEELAELDRTVQKDLFAVPLLSPAEAAAENQKLLMMLNAAELPDKNPKRKAAASRNEIQKIYDATEKNPVAELCKTKKYDPKNEGIGYCFGRATAAHIETLKAGLQKDKVRKIWVVGDMRTGADQWRYHVSTIVRGDDGQWWTIDPILGKPLPVETWYKHMKKVDANGQLRLHTTEAKKFWAGDGEAYDPRTFKDPYYNGFFTDLMSGFKADAKEILRRRNSASQK